MAAPARQPEARGTDGAAAFCLNYFEPKSSRRMDWARKGGKAKGDTAAAGCWLLAAGWTAPQSGLLKPLRPAVGAAIVDSDFSPPGRFMLQSDVVIGKLTILENSPLLQQIFRLRFYFYLLSCNSLIINFKGC